MYVIKAALFIIQLPFYKKFAHNFWVLEDSQNQRVLAELHGLATSRRDGKIAPIGYKSEHSLRAHHIVLCDEFASTRGFTQNESVLVSHVTQPVYQKDDTLIRWLKAVAAIEEINKLDLNYPRAGFSLPLNATVNSNSVYHTFADVMQIEAYVFPDFIHIGLAKSLCNQIGY